MFNKQLGLSLPRILTNQVLDLHEAGDRNNLLNTNSRHLIGQPKYLDSSTILVVMWRDLIGLRSWLQRYKSCIDMTPDPSSLLRRGWPARLGGLSYFNWSPLKVVPPDCPQQKKWSPRTVYGSISGPPRLFVVAVSGPPVLHVVPHLYVLLHHRLRFFVSHLEHEQSLLSASIWHHLHT